MMEGHEPLPKVVVEGLPQSPGYDLSISFQMDVKRNDSIRAITRYRKKVFVRSI